MSLNNLIKRYIILYVIVLIILLIISYKLFGSTITILFNLFAVIFSYIILEEGKKVRALLLIGTILWFPVQLLEKPSENNNVSLSSEQVNQIANSVIIKFQENFGDFGPINISSIDEKCISNVTTLDYIGKGFNYSAYLFDGCDVKKLSTKEGPLPKTSLMAYLVYPLWNKTEREKHYFFDVYYNNLRKNRLSLFVDEHNYLIGKFFDEKGIAYEVPIDVSDWNSKEWALIIFQSNEIDQQISVSYINIPQNKLKMNFVNVTDYALDFDQINMYVGSDIFGNNQADAVVGYAPPWWIFSDYLGYSPVQRNVLS